MVRRLTASEVTVIEGPVTVWPMTPASPVALSVSVVESVPTGIGLGLPYLSTSKYSEMAALLSLLLLPLKVKSLLL